MERPNVYVVGVGLTKFIKPRGLVDYPELGFEAGVKAMLDAGINFDDVDQGIACYCYGDSTCGQRVFYQFGMTQIPIYNVNNNCSTGSTGLFMARQLIRGGMADCILVVGFEKMAPGSLKSNWTDRVPTNERTIAMVKATRGYNEAVPRNTQTFGNAGREVRIPMSWTRISPLRLTKNASIWRSMVPRSKILLRLRESIISIA